MKNTVVNLDNRKLILGGIVIAVTLIFILQLANLQIFSRDYKNFADNNAFYRKTLYPARGIIFDRNGELLILNQPTYDIIYRPKDVLNLDTLDFCSTLDITVEQFERRIANIKDKNKNPGYSSYTMQMFMTQLTTKESSVFQEKLYKFPGFFIQNRTVRQYATHNAGLLFGYVSEINKKQLDNDTDKYYARGDYKGQSGLELQYDKILRGEKGQEIILRDAKGQFQGKFENGIYDKAPISGKNITLSLDIELQAYGEYLLQNKLGSIVMIEPQTGEIICMATSPTYDPALLLGKNYSSSYFKLEENPIKPLYNKAIQGTYPPGSVFKPTQGAIFLEEGAITTTSAFPCAHGYMPLGGKPKCHGHYSPIAIVGALTTSCNAFFCYGLTAMLHNSKYKNVKESFDVWEKHMYDMGFGKTLGIDLPHENKGYIPNNAFYTRYHTANWKAANVISIAIGQGEITTTPLQLANFASIVANKGYYHVPHIVKAIEGDTLNIKYTEKNKTNIKQEHWNIIAEGMRNAVTSGTCRIANLPDIEVAGKTGTAENPHGLDHSIFIGFAPIDNPKVAIAVVIENAGFGAWYGVPFGRLMIQKYLKGKTELYDKYLEEQKVAVTILPSEYLQWKREQLHEEQEKLKSDN